MSTKLIATLETSKGTIRFELLTQDAPKTTENFKLLVERGYYQGIIFHRVINGFMIQGGDPTGTGAGGNQSGGGLSPMKSIRPRPSIKPGMYRERWRWPTGDQTPTAVSFSSCTSGLRFRQITPFLAA